MEVRSDMTVFDNFRTLLDSTKEEYKDIFDAHKSDRILVAGIRDILVASSHLRSEEIPSLQKRTCEVVDAVNSDPDLGGRFWNGVGGVLLISMLKEFAKNGFFSLIDKVFMAKTKSGREIVTRLSVSYKDEFKELFGMLPKDYQKKLLSTTVTDDIGGSHIREHKLIGGDSTVYFS